MIDILNMNNDKIKMIDMLRPFQKIIIERNNNIGCSMVLEQYVTDSEQPLKFNDERSRYSGENKIGFDRAFGVSST
jgi:chromatin remodeling complex protein RSC6